MGLQIILSIHQVDPDTDFDVTGANVALMADFHGGFGELYDEFTSNPDWVGPFEWDGSKLTIAENWDSEFDGYGNQTMVWGCYQDKVFEIIAAHIKAGKIVFLIDIEGNDNQYRVCTPNVVKKVNAASIAF